MVACGVVIEPVREIASDGGCHDVPGVKYVIIEAKGAIEPVVRLRAHSSGGVSFVLVEGWIVSNVLNRIYKREHVLSKHVRRIAFGYKFQRQMRQTYAVEKDAQSGLGGGALDAGAPDIGAAVCEDGNFTIGLIESDGVACRAGAEDGSVGYLHRSVKMMMWDGCGTDDGIEAYENNPDLALLPSLVD